ncbi:MAG: PilW family protein [Acidovorax sp.]
MATKTIAGRACPISAKGQKYFKLRAQRGVTLIELMVGVAIGLLTVAVAMGALLVSRGVSGTVSDASLLQQQAAYAYRVIGQQVRQAGSLYLNRNPVSAAASDAFMAPVAFETAAPASGSGNGFDPATDTISAASGALTVGYRRYLDAVYPAASTQTLVRNCVAGSGDSHADQRLESVFQLNGDQLRCTGNGEIPQPIIQNVANFQVRYLVQDVSTTPGSPQIRYLSAADVGTQWQRVQGVEVCLVLYGTEPIDMPASASYTDCDETTSVNMASLTGARARRIHMVFRNVYQLRSQGLV